MLPVKGVATGAAKGVAAGAGLKRATPKFGIFSGAGTATTG